jgi:alpha-ribazole phosphatase
VLRGRVDHALSAEGWQQMFQSTGVAPPEQAVNSPLLWDKVLSSPLQRCRKFAEHLGARYKVAVSIEEHWQEIDYGDWDGMPLSEWRKIAAPQFKQFRQDMTALMPPNGEDYVTFSERVLEAWQQIHALDDGSHVLLVTHGGVMRVILPTVLGIPLNKTSSLAIPFACLSRVEITRHADTTQASLQFHNARL